MQASSERKAELDKAELREFISRSRARLQVILERLQWTENKTLEQIHNVKNEDEATDNEKEPELPTSFGAQHKNVLTKTELCKLLNDDNVQIPKKFSDLQLNFTREQKLSIYEHVISQTGKCTEPETSLPALHDGQLTFAEIVAQRKREKKNKRRHRISKPSHIEEVRGLVDLQMQALEQYWDANAKNKAEDTRKGSSNRNDSRYRHEGHRKKEMARQSRRDHRCDSRTRRRSCSKERHDRGSDRRRSRSPDRKYHKRDDKYRKERRSRSRNRSRSRGRHKHKHKSHKDRSRSRSSRRRRSRSRSREKKGRIN